jgi:hypothetical protein
MNLARGMPVYLHDELHNCEEVDMQIGSRHESSPRTKPTGKTSDGKPSKRAKSKARDETLHLKAKPAVATAVHDMASRIATAAYYRAAQRGFEPGHELDDWLHAEQQVRSQNPS